MGTADGKKREKERRWRGDQRDLKRFEFETSIWQKSEGSRGEKMRQEAREGRKGRQASDGAVHTAIVGSRRFD